MQTSTFGERLRQLRLEHDLSQAGLGALLNLSHSTAQRYETGRRRPDPETLGKLASLFGVSVDFLLGRSPYRWAPKDIPPEMLSKYPLLKVAIEAPEPPAVDAADLPLLLRQAGLNPGDVEIVMKVIQRLLKDEGQEGRGKTRGG